MIRRFTAVLAASVTALAGVLVAPGTASASVRQIHAHGFKYAFGNWDYDTGAKVYDNPVSIIFISRRADLVDRVYDQIDGVGLDSGGSKMRLSGTGPSRPGVGVTGWTSHSAGRKGAFGCWGKCGKKTDIHLRTYGPDGRQGTQVYQGSAGYAPYYLVATVHFDANENTSKATFGYQDTARKLLVDKMTSRHQWHRVAVISADNKCNSIRNRNQHCQHDGTAWVVSIDG